MPNYTLPSHLLQILANSESESANSYNTWTINLPHVPWQAVATHTPQSEPLQDPTPMPYYAEGVPKPKVDIKVGDVWKHHQGVFLAKILEDCGESWGEEWVRVDIYRADDHTDFLEMGVKRKKEIFGRYYTLLSRVPKKHLRHYFEGVEDVGK